MLNILFMMIANLVGFVIGIDGVRYMLQQLVAAWQGESGHPDLQNSAAEKNSSYVLPLA